MSRPVKIAISLFAVWLLFATAILFSQIAAPQIPFAGNIGSQGPFALFNSGTLQFASDANHTMVNPEWSALGIRVTSSVSLTATRSLITPAGRFTFIVENATTGGQAITVIGPSGAGVTIPNGQTATVWNDGTNYVQTGSSGSLSAIGANAVLGNPTNSSAVPGSVGLPSCGTSLNAIAYVLNTGFACNTFGGMALQNPNSVAITGGTALFSTAGTTGLLFGNQIAAGTSTVPGPFAAATAYFSGSSATLIINASSAATDAKNAGMTCLATTGGLHASACQFSFFNDANTVANAVWEITRSGATPLAMYVDVPLYVNGGSSGNLVCTQNGTNCPAGGVSTVFGRSGPAITAVSGDYSFSLISGTIANGQLPSAISVASLTASGTTQAGSFNAISSSFPFYQLDVSGAGTDAKFSYFDCQPTVCEFQFRNDANTAASPVIQYFRSGFVPTAVQVNAPLYVGGSSSGNLACTQNGTNCPASTVLLDTSGTVQAGGHVVIGSFTMTGTGTHTVTFSGAAVFSSSTSYACFAVPDDTGGPAEIAEPSYSSGSSVDFLDDNSIHHYRFTCTGN